MRAAECYVFDSCLRTFCGGYGLFLYTNRLWGMKRGQLTLLQTCEPFSS